MSGYQITVIVCWMIGLVCNLTRLTPRIAGDTPVAVLSIFITLALHSILPICLIEGGFFK